MPARKELHFFGRDITGPPAHSPIKDPERYLALFTEAGPCARVGEASPMYLSSSHAPREIREFSGEVKIIIMLRNPVDMVYSIFCTGFYPDARGLGIERYATPPGVNMLARNAHHVERYLEVFGPENVHVIVHDNLAASPARTYLDTCTFLGIAGSFRPDFVVHAPARAPRFQTLRDAVAEPASLSRQVAHHILPAALRAHLRAATWRFATMPPRPLDSAIRSRLQEGFRAEIEDLSAVLSRDLSTWVS